MSSDEAFRVETCAQFREPSSALVLTNSIAVFGTDPAEQPMQNPSSVNVCQGTESLQVRHSTITSAWVSKVSVCTVDAVGAVGADADELKFELCSVAAVAKVGPFGAASSFVGLSFPSFVFPASRYSCCRTASAFTHLLTWRSFGPRPAFMSGRSALRCKSASRLCILQSSRWVSAFLSSAPTSISTRGFESFCATASVLRDTALLTGFSSSPARRFFCSILSLASSPTMWSGIARDSG
mmetsp:Transcript_4266/g.12084  ORF Transcript_4266/g.12084 Transcript_4266/m.12084 type:complete len:239 (+) Transcript_4266:232-948(+)